METSAIPCSRRFNTSRQRSVKCTASELIDSCRGLVKRSFCQKRKLMSIPWHLRTSSAETFGNSGLALHPPNKLPPWPVRISGIGASFTLAPSARLTLSVIKAPLPFRWIYRLTRHLPPAYAKPIQCRTLALQLFMAQMPLIIQCRVLWKALVWWLESTGSARGGDGAA